MDIRIQATALLYALLWHGGGHLAAARAVGIRLHRLRHNATGFRLVSDRAFPGYKAEALCALGGPFGNLLGAALLALLARFPALRVSASSFLTEATGLSCFLGGLNLLPLPGFDGRRMGEALILAKWKHPEKGLLLLQSAGLTVLILLWLVAVYVLLRRGNALSLLLFCLRLFRQSDGEKESSYAENGFGRIRENTGVFRWFSTNKPN